MSDRLLMAQELCEQARLLYVRDGYVVPTLILCNPQGERVSLMPTPGSFGGHPREQFFSLVMAMAPVFDIRYICAITEAWSRQYPHDSAPENLRRGQLSEEADTDPEVRTVVMVGVVEVALPEPRLATVMSTVTGDPRAPEWDTHEQDGEIIGALYETMLGAWLTRAEDLTKPFFVGADDPVTRAERLAEMGVAQSMLDLQAPERNN